MEAKLADIVNPLFDWIENHQLDVFGHLLLLSSFAFWFLTRTAPKPPTRKELLSLNETQWAFGQMATKQGAAPAVAAQGAKEKPEVKLDPPKDDPISLEELKQYDGTDASKPIYVAIKGTVFDVSSKREMYGPGASYHIFAGKDGSRGLGKSSLKPEDAVADYSTLDASELKVLDDWVAYYKKRYNIIGRVSSKSNL